MKKAFLLCIICVLLIPKTLFSQNKDYKAYIVSNAHFDTQWNWDVQTSINEYVKKTLDQNLFLLERYPNYIFNFEGGIKYAWMKEYYPLQYEKVKQYVKEGRWHVTGSTWDANDVNIPSPESFTRNILYGQHFYQSELGVKGTDIFLPDCFGFGWTLPTIIHHSGLIGFSTQKLQWRHKPFHGKSKIPFEMGLWQGVDGSKIMLVADAHNYTTKWRDEDLSHSNYLLNLAKANPTKAVYHYYGTGDTGGAPDIQSVRTLEKSLKGDGPLQIISATSDQLYKDYLPFGNHPELPVFNGELLMDVHGTGCYTSQSAMKLYNRRNENLADAAERASVVAHWLGAGVYPKQTLTEAWKRVLWHQFHDDLTGTSIPKAYEFSWNDELISLKQFASVLTQSVAAVAGELNTQVKGIPLVVYNPVAHEVSDVIEVKLQLPVNAKSVSVYNEKGQLVASQLLSVDKGKATVLLAAKVPASGFAVYEIRTTASKANTSLKISEKSIENRFYKLTLDQNGDIASVYDKINARELVAKGKTIRLALFPENESFAWPAWEILKKTIDKEPISITDNVKVSIAENGSVRSALCVERTYGSSTIRQYIRLTHGGQDDRIDIYNEVDWQSTNALLKAEFPLNLNAPEAIYDLGVGNIKRGNNTETAYEVYAQNWVDMFDEAQQYGVSIMNDSRYGWDKPSDNTIRLTLLHTPKTKGGYAYQDKQDFGQHHFTYSIYGHRQSYAEAQTVLRAEVLNQPISAFVTEKRKGTLGKTFSFVRTNNPHVQLKAMKQAEHSDEIVLRFYETKGAGNQGVTVTLPATIQSAYEINGVEEDISNAQFNGNELKFKIHGFGMKSFRVKLQTEVKAQKQTNFTAIPLKFNIRAASFNAFRNEANFDGRGNSYAAELLPESIEYKNFSFVLGNPETFNALKCKGDTIQLPKGKYNRIYLLAASTRGDVKARFKTGNLQQDVVIPYYSGFIGQWGHTGYTEGFLKSSDVVYIGTHKHNGITNKDIPMEYTYMFPIALDFPENADKLILPAQSNVVIFAIVAVNETTTASVVTDLLNVKLPDNSSVETLTVKRNLVFGKKVIERSGQVNRREMAEMAVDEEMSTKWCDLSDVKNKFIVVDLEKVEELRSWYVLHAAHESLGYITKEYSLQVKTTENAEWQTVDTVFDNSAPETERLLQAPVKARYVRLYISKPDQSEGTTTRIYEFSVY
jgi:alpha-mannosidase